MTLEQRVEALEKELADIKAQQKTGEEVGELMRHFTGGRIKNAQRSCETLPKLHKEPCALTSERSIEQLLDDAAEHINMSTS